MLHITDRRGCWERAPFGQVQILRHVARDPKNVPSNTAALLVTRPPPIYTVSLSYGNSGVPGEPLFFGKYPCPVPGATWRCVTRETQRLAGYCQRAPRPLQGLCPGSGTVGYDTAGAVKRHFKAKGSI